MPYSQQTRVESSPRHITVRKIGGKYMTKEPAAVKTNLRGYDVKLQYVMGRERVLVTLVDLRPDGWLTVYAGYSYDGPSGAVDTPSTMRAAAFHDALCELIAHGLIPRESIDQIAWLYTQVCRDDGMLGLRAWLHFRATRFASPEPSEYLETHVFP